MGDTKGKKEKAKDQKQIAAKQAKVQQQKKANQHTKTP